MSSQKVLLMQITAYSTDYLGIRIKSNILYFWCTFAKYVWCLEQFVLMTFVTILMLLWFTRPCFLFWFGSFSVDSLLATSWSCMLSVAGAVAHINKTVEEGDSQNTLQALQIPSAGLRAVHPDCADAYQAELAHRQTANASKGESTCSN